VIAFANVCDAVAATAAKSAKIERLAAYLNSLERDDLIAASRFLSGAPLASKDDRRLAIGGRTILAAARHAWGFDDAALARAYRENGDLGEALGALFREPAIPTLFAETLTPASLAQLLDEVASVAGRASAKKREFACERILRACRVDREAVYAVKILTGDLRIGLREGLVLDAIAAAFEREPQAVRRAAMAAGDAGAVAVAARDDLLASIEVRYGAPIGFMLASPIAFASSYRELATGAWLVEDKYDGIRAQAHKSGASVRLFSRTFSDAVRAFPEIVAALAAQPGDFILDGEIVARRDGRALPFRYLQPRLQRVDPSAELRAEIPVAFVAFDALAAGRSFLVDRPLEERRAALAAAIEPQAELELAPWQALESDASPERISELFEAARERGNEGLVFKRSDAPYVPGRRGKWWLKLKRELATLDCVVVAVEWGHGKRAKVLSDYTFAVRRSAERDELLTIGKAYTGLTDVEISTMTRWFEEHAIAAGRYGFAVEPAIVVEIAFDIIQKSELHPSGFALRFPRIVRLRPDKPASEIDTLERVEEIYAEMLSREGVAE
jgi:DNA ligase-1